MLWWTSPVWLRWDLEDWPSASFSATHHVEELDAEIKLVALVTDIPRADLFEHLPLWSDLHNLEMGLSQWLRLSYNPVLENRGFK